MMRLTAVRDAAGDIANCSVGIVKGCPRNRFAGATVASDKPRERDNRLVPDLGVSIAGQHFNEIGDNVGDANTCFTAPLTDETVHSALADGRDGILQCAAEGIRRRVARVMIQKEQAEAPHRRISVAECGDLNGGDRYLNAETGPAALAEREPPVDEIIRDFEVSSRHRASPR
jgi:hypothetical protein